MRFNQPFVTAAFAACLTSLIGLSASTLGQDFSRLTVDGIYGNSEFSEKSVDCQWLPNTNGNSAAYTIT